MMYSSYTPLWSETLEMVNDANSKPRDIVPCTHGSGTRDQSGLGFKLREVRRTIHKDNGIYKSTTSSLTMEVEAAKQMVQ